MSDLTKILPAIESKDPMSGNFSTLFYMHAYNRIYFCGTQSIENFLKEDAAKSALDNADLKIILCQ